MLLLKDNILNNVVLNNDNDFSYSLLNPYNGQIHLNKFILNRNIVKHIYFHFPNEEAKFWRPKVVFSKSPISDRNRIQNRLLWSPNLHHFSHIAKLYYLLICLSVFLLQFFL